jgi:hypothetical protein
VTVSCIVYPAELGRSQRSYIGDLSMNQEAVNGAISASYHGSGRAGGTVVVEGVHKGAFRRVWTAAVHLSNRKDSRDYPFG